jgi:cytochrome c oxidase subunit 2
LIFFAIKYKRKTPNDKTPYISHNSTLEFLWSFIPFVIFMVAFAWGWAVFHQFRTFPENALEVAVEAQKWNWSFVYKNGRRTGGEFTVPVGENVKLVMTSKDVIHSFYVPAFRNKQDVVPGRYSALWFKANQEGNYQVFCAEYCGDNHSGMLAKVHVVSREKFEEFLEKDPYKGMSLLEMGKTAYTKFGCTACHSTDGSKLVGPTFKGVWGRAEQTDAGPVTVDENYVRESIMNPTAKTVAGFPKGAMPVFAGQISDQEMLGIIEFLKTVK